LQFMDFSHYSWNEFNEYVHSDLDSFSTQISNEALMFYGENSEYGDNPMLSYTTITADVTVGCNEDIYSVMRTDAKPDIPIFRYVVVNRPSNTIGLFGFNCTYSCHGWDIVSFFNLTQDWKFSPQKQDLEFGDLMRLQISNFLRFRVPFDSSWKSFGNTAIINQTISILEDETYHAKQCAWWNINNLLPYGWSC